MECRGKKEGEEKGKGRREKKGKERREEEERGAGGRRREMSPPKGKSWIRHCQRSYCSWSSRRWLSARCGLWLERNCPDRPPRASLSSGFSGRYIGSGLTGQATRARLGTQTVGADELQTQRLTGS